MLEEVEDVGSEGTRGVTITGDLVLEDEVEEERIGGGGIDGRGVVFWLITVWLSIPSEKDNDLLDFFACEVGSGWLLLQASELEMGRFLSQEETVAVVSRRRLLLLTPVRSCVTVLCTTCVL